MESFDFGKFEAEMNNLKHKNVSYTRKPLEEKDLVHEEEYDSLQDFISEGTENPAMHDTEMEDYLTRKIELNTFVKLSEILTKVIVRRDELANLHKEFTVQEESYRKIYGVNKTPQLMTNEERSRYKQFVQLENIK